MDIVKQKRLGRLFYEQNVRLLERADSVLAASPLYFERSPFLSRYKNKCRVIPYCISGSRMAVTDEILKDVTGLGRYFVTGACELLKVRV